MFVDLKSNGAAHWLGGGGGGDKPDNGFVKKGVVRERELEERARALHLFWGN